MIKRIPFSALSIQQPFPLYLCQADCILAAILPLFFPFLFVPVQSKVRLVPLTYKPPPLLKRALSGRVFQNQAH